MLKSNRTVIAVVIVVLILLSALGIAVALLGHPKKPTPRPLITVSATPESTLEEGEDPHEEAAEKAIVTHIRQPLIQALPYGTQFWRLEYAGSHDGKLHVKAIVYYQPGQDPAAKIREQDPFVLDYLKKTGQADGTYVVEYTPQQVETY